MIFGIGVDVLDITRIEKLLAKYESRFIDHLLTALEKEQYADTNRGVHYLATRFSGKEAISKALGTGLRKPMTLHAVSILNDLVGKPELVFDKTLDKFLRSREVNRIHISFSHEGSLLTSFAVAECA
ncbi:MAG: holo-ACP synthase [Burkholderiales bacterium]|jgi:holo-[acyl-carrier protein] synthase